MGYGLAPSARGHGFAAEALAAVAELAAGHGVTYLDADTETHNIASQRTLERARFVRVGSRDDLYLFELALGRPAGRDPHRARGAGV